ncbi:MAG: hypothetical protein JNL69_03050 [Bacteroidia bacterium]|nr:hypothetical protein [Bacteroidia bacterium]
MAELERSNGGRFFSIRDFKRMFETISDKEPQALLDFLTMVLTQPYPGAVNFGAYILAKFQALNTVGLTNAEIDTVLIQLNIKARKGRQFTYATINNTNIDLVYSKLIYNTRNSIVHNKATEFHLTYESMTQQISRVLEHFLIPSIEACTFYLVTDANCNLVRFTHRQLELWPQ